MNLFVPLAIAGAVVVGFSVPLVLGKVSRNDVYGIRTPRTMEGPISDWYAVNKRGGTALIFLGSILFAVGVLGAVIRQHSYLGVTLTTGLFLSGIIFVMVKYWK